MDKKFFKDIVNPILVLGAICLIITLLLALTNSLTKDLIMNNSIDLEAAKSVLKISSDDVKAGKLSEMAYSISVNDEIKGYVFLSESEGYGGPIRVMTGLNVDGSVSGVRILSISETPGLGGRVQEESFLGQFLTNAFIGKFNLVKNNKEKEGEIQALTSATISSQAVVNAVNKSLNEYNRLMGGETE